MHRRRSRDRRDRKPPREAAPPPAAGKRRAREGAVVPDELLLSKGKEGHSGRGEGHPGRRNRGNDPGSSNNVVLVTGFDCFGGETLNPSWEICKRLPREIAGLRVETCLVPCEFHRAIEVVAEAIERHRPSIVLDQRG